MIVAPGSAMIVAPGSAIIAGPASALSCPSDDPACVEQNSDTESFLSAMCKSPGQEHDSTCNCSHCPKNHSMWGCLKVKQVCKGKVYWGEASIEKMKILGGFSMAGGVGVNKYNSKIELL